MKKVEEKSTKEKNLYFIRKNPAVGRYIGKGRRLSDHTNMVSVDNIDLHISESAASDYDELPIQHDRIFR